MPLVYKNNGILIDEAGKLLYSSDTGNPCDCCEPPCGTIANSGGGMLTVTNYVMPARAGIVQFSYHAYNVPDSFKVEGGGVVFINTGPVSTGVEPVIVSFCKPLGLTKVTVTVTGTNPGTLWLYSIGCPEAACPNPLP